MSDSRDFNDYTCTVCGQVITQMGHAPNDPCPGKLGRFGHHPNPAIDFCVEVDAIEGLEADVKAGLSKPTELIERVGAAMGFTVGGDERAVRAKDRLRGIDGRLARVEFEVPEEHKIEYEEAREQVANRLQNVCLQTKHGVLGALEAVALVADGAGIPLSDVEFMEMAREGWKRGSR